MDKQSLGKWGEETVCTYLQKNGYAILQRNYRVRGGEIDIVAQKKDHIVFVEVKARRTDEFGSPAEAVGARKQQKIRLAARQYVAAYGKTGENYTFDVAEVFVREGAADIRYIKNAFC